MRMVIRMRKLYEAGFPLEIIPDKLQDEGFEYNQPVFNALKTITTNKRKPLETKKNMFYWTMEQSQDPLDGWLSEWSWHVPYLIGLDNKPGSWWSAIYSKEYASEGEAYAALVIHLARSPGLWFF